MSLVPILACCANIGMFVSQLTIIKIIKQSYKTQTPLSNIQFLASSLSSILWFKYGLIKDDTTVWLVNIFGTLISFYILGYFWSYSHNRKHVETNILITLLLALLLIIYVDRSQNPDKVDWFSLACCSVTLFFLGSPLSQIGNVVRLRDASVMMPEMTTLAFCNNLLWSLYGHLKDDPYMMIPNGIGTTLCAIQLFLIVYYGRKSASALPVAVVGGGGGGAAAAGMSSDAVPMAEIP